jgi:predicted XRE-type DNA-binding protein
MKKITEGSGNVFADLGLRNADELEARAALTRQIYLLIRKRGLTQIEAADRLGLKQPDVSRLMRGQYTRFSTERLMRMIKALGHDVEISVKQAPRSRPSGRIVVVAA